VSVNIQARFKKDQSHMDGLGAIADELAKEPLRPRIIVATVECTRVTHNVQDGTDTPTVKLTAVEVVDGADAVTVSGMMERLYAKRTGRDDLPASLFDEPMAPAGTGEQPAIAEAPWPGDVEFNDGGVQAGADELDGDEPPGDKPKRGRR
jgi:hypothetical protein